MTSFTFSAEQVRSAPPEVRRWMENEIARAFASQAHFEHDAATTQASALAACTIDQVAEIFNLVSGNFLITQVFFELARETSIAHGLSSLHVLNLSEMRRHLQLDDARLLLECLNVINQALQRVRNDPEASLFASDERGHIFIHETTCRNIRRLREQLIPTHSLTPRPQPAEARGFGPEAREPIMQPEHAFAGNRDT